jgi:hypothetical protein
MAIPYQGIDFSFLKGENKQSPLPLVSSMLQLTFTNEDIQQLHYERFHHPHPHVQRKMEALYLKSRGYPHWEICQLVQAMGVPLRSLKVR